MKVRFGSTARELQSKVVTEKGKRSWYFYQDSWGSINSSADYDHKNHGVPTRSSNHLFFVAKEVEAKVEPASGNILHLHAATERNQICRRAILESPHASFKNWLAVGLAPWIAVGSGPSIDAGEK